MEEHVSPEEHAAQLEALRARFLARRPDARGDALARAEQAKARAAFVREFLAKQADRRNVPRARDIRRWVDVPRVDGAIFAEVDAFLGERGAPEDGRWGLLVLSGGAGVGKTSAMARAVTRHPTDALFVLASDAAECLQSRVRSFQGDRVALELVARMREVDLLTIDEAGTEPRALACTLEQLAIARCMDGLATILGTNLTLEEFRAAYTDPRLASRLNAAEGRFVECPGRDLRGTP